MRVFLDTNILMDVAQGREPFYENSAEVIRFVHQENMQAFISWHSMATIFYILNKPWGDEKTKSYLRDILSWSKLAPTSQSSALKALEMEGEDFEDDLQIQCALAANCDCICTRNTKDFKKSPIPALSPTEFLVRYNPALGD
ncbi:MAG: type II toxin-antitoxin system VapC family toxin [Akkermansiaceae bacterium]